MELYTAHKKNITKAKEYDTAIIDVTPSGHPAFCVKHRLHTLVVSKAVDNQDEFLERFKEELFDRVNMKGEWEWFLKQPRVTVVCDTDAGDLCYRTGLVELFLGMAKNWGINANYIGEISSQPNCIDPLKAGKILNFCDSKKPKDLDSDLSDLDLQREVELEAIRNRPNRRLEMAPDLCRDYLVTMYNVIYNHVDRLNHHGLWRGFVKLSKNKNAPWVTMVPDWEYRLQGTFEYVLYGVCQDLNIDFNAVSDKETSALYSEIRFNGNRRVLDKELYNDVMEKFHMCPNLFGIDTFFLQLMYCWNRERQGKIEDALIKIITN